MNAQVAPPPGFGSIFLPHVVTIFFGHHFEGEFVVVAQEGSPLAAVRDVWGVSQDIANALS